MRQCALFCGAIAFLASPAVAQQRPDFSGTWAQTADPAASTTAKPAPAALGQQFTIVQDGPTLTLTRSFAGTVRNDPLYARRLGNDEPHAGPTLRA